MHRPATIDIDELSGDERSLVAGQEGDHARDVRRDPTTRDGLARRLLRLYVASGRDHLIQTISDLTNRSRRYSPYGYRTWQTLDAALDSHVPILEAIDAGDAALAERLTGEHMAAAGARLLEAVRLEAGKQAGVLALGPAEEPGSETGA